MSPRSSSPCWWRAFAVFVLGVTVVLPLLVHDDSYGEAPIPGTATVHLPAGPVDVTLGSEGLDDDASVPPLSIRISGPDGTPPPAVTESRQAKCLSSDCDAQTRIWVVQVPREADYRVTVDGEAYGKYQPTLTFGRFVWNDLLLALLALGTIIRWAVLIVGGVALIALFIGVLVDARPAKEKAAQAANPPGAERLRAYPGCCCSGWRAARGGPGAGLSGVAPRCREGVSASACPHSSSSAVRCLRSTAGSTFPVVSRCVGSPSCCLACSSRASVTLFRSGRPPEGTHP